MKTFIILAIFFYTPASFAVEMENIAALQEKTMKSVEANLLKYGYNETYQKPLKEMKTWITEFNQNKDWLCQ